MHPRLIGVLTDDPINEDVAQGGVVLRDASNPRLDGGLHRRRVVAVPLRDEHIHMLKSLDHKGVSHVVQRSGVQPCSPGTSESSGG